MSLLPVLDQLDRSYCKSAPIALGVLSGLSLSYVAFSYGAGVTILVLGRKGAIQALGNAPSSRTTLFLGISMIPILLIGVEAYDVEGKILALWRKSISKWVMSSHLLGPVVEWLWPSPAREPHISTQEGLMGSLDYFTRSLSAGLLFPFIAYAVGLLFRNIIHSQAKRTVVGGVIFFSLKTLLKVYLRQQEYRRQGSRRVLNYESPMTTSHPSHF